MSKQLMSVFTSLILAGFIWLASVHNLFILALFAVLIVESPSYRRLPSKDEIIKVTPEILAGLNFVLLIAIYPRALSQISLAILYVGWRTWLGRIKAGSIKELVAVMVNQILVFETLFLMSTIWNIPNYIVLLLLWIQSFILVYALLTNRSDKSPAVLASAWALIVVEVSWVFLTWTVSYALAGGYLVVPQATIVLGGLTYCAGSIYIAQRQSRLSKSRLTEYLLITLVLIVIVIAGTTWKGTI